MSDEAAFLRAIAAESDVDLPRLVYADWLEEQGETERMIRAEFIRIQCALETMLPSNEQFRTLQEREQVLFRELWLTLLEPVRSSFDLSESQFRPPQRPRGGTFFSQLFGMTLRDRLLEQLHGSGSLEINLHPWHEDPQGPIFPSGLRSIAIRRGFIDDLIVCSDTKPEVGKWDRYFQEHFLHGLTIRDGPLANLWASLPIIPQLRKLGFIFDSGSGSWDAVLNLFTFSEPLLLKELELFQAPIDRESLQQLVDSWIMEQLTTLRWSPRDPDEVLVLAESGKVQNLQTLDLSVGMCGSLGLHHLAKSSRFQKLETLDLSSSSIGDTGVRSLIRSQHLGSLRRLDLQENRLTDRALRDLSTSFSEQLRILNVTGNRELTDAGASALASSSHLDSLELLVVNEALKRTDGGLALRERFGSRVVFE